MNRPQTCEIIHEWLASLPAKTASNRVDRLDIAIATTQGLLRRDNQDRACFARIRSPDFEQGPISIGLLCDGMGGMDSGAECAILAISVVVSQFSALLEHADPGPAFVRAIRAANDEIFERFGGRGGTTLAAVLFSRAGRLGVNAGDSRIYSVSRKREVAQLSVDDTMATAALHMDAISALALAQLELGDHLTQFLGIGPELRLQEIDLDDLTESDRLFLMSDGAWRSPDSTFLGLMRDASGSLEAAQKIVKMSDRCGGVDNTTVLALSRLADLASSGNPARIQHGGGVIDLWNAFGSFSVLTDSSTAASL